jgi:pSer/pThr/pTyr-binding forkhead associated (FHA) protein
MSETDETLDRTPAKGPATSPKSVAVKTFMFALTTDRGPKLLAFRSSNILVGRLPDNHLSLNHSSVSRRHAVIAVTNRGVTVEDMGSQNGTTINGVIIKQQTAIRPGDIIRIGHIPLYYFGFINMDAPPVPDLVENSIVITPMLPAMT